MSGVSGSYSVSSRSSVSSSDDEIVVISESSSESLEENVTKLPAHDRDSLSGSSSSTSKGKGPDAGVREDKGKEPDDLKIVIGGQNRLEKAEEISESDIGAQNSVEQQGKRPLSPREVALLTPTPAQHNKHRIITRIQRLAVCGAITSTLFAGSFTGISIYYSTLHDDYSFWATIANGVSAGITAVGAGLLFYLSLRMSGVLAPRTEENLM